MINCLIVDDEPIARNGLIEHIGQVDFLNVAATCKDAFQALSELRNNEIDLLFIDIQMPIISGINFVKSLSKPPLIIFTTAYHQYALESYELDAFDYLLKPISFPRFLKSALKVKKHFELVQNKKQEDNDLFFFIKCDRRIEKINFNDIIYINGLSNYLTIHTSNRSYTTYLTFKSLEEKLPPSKFIRIHKSYLIAIHAIQRIENDFVLVQNISLPISKHYKNNLKNRIDIQFYKRT